MPSDLSFKSFLKRVLIPPRLKKCNLKAKFVRLKGIFSGWIILKSIWSVEIGYLPKTPLLEVTERRYNMFRDSGRRKSFNKKRQRGISF